MSSAALESTVSIEPAALSEGAVTYNFGQPLRETTGARKLNPSTGQIDIRKSVSVSAPIAKPQTTLRAPVPEEYFKPIKNWEGVVDTINESTFVATMREAENSSDRGNEQFEIDIEDVELGDRELLKIGGIFYFTVGYRIHRGTRFKGTQIVFRRMPMWSKKDIERVQTRAEKLLGILNGKRSGGRRE